MTQSENSLYHTFPSISGYRMVEQLYVGSRTAVYRALQTATQHPVVIKVMQRDYPSFAELVQFRNQYTIAKNLPITGIVRPLSLEPVANGYALVMPDDGAVALGQYVQRQSLDLEEVLQIALQLADILHELGQHKVVHKDIKPANILIQLESKQVKLIDFSIASLLPKETQEIQSPNVLEGTLNYLAPEQTGRMNRGIDYRADFYALGVTLYQLLSGTLPFISDDPLELIHCHIARIPVPVHEVNPGVPRMVSAIVSKLMAKNAEDRYQNALGLRHDLAQCLTQWQTTSEILEFELGQRDLSDRFLIPEKLYGRENEVQTLLAAFDRVAEGATELMLVAGFSGIGKTAVINEVHKPILRQKGYFIKGKFDQFNRNIPLSAFVQSFRNLMGYLRSESESQLAQWKIKILQAVGESGQVLIEVIPELVDLIGSQPPAPELSGTAAQNRFNHLFQQFIQVFTRAEHPLVIFLDDLQWADRASLQLMQVLMGDSHYLLILGAYRDNEVSPVHPLMLSLEELKKAATVVNTLTLRPLAPADTNQLIADTLRCPEEVALPLTQLVDRKTQGNPFFTTQFLKALYEDGCITFDHDLCYWQCDIAEINALSLTDDVVEFMALQLQKLPESTQTILKLAACVGNQFDLETLAVVSEQSLTQTATALWRALQEGLVLPNSQVYKFFQVEKSAVLDEQKIVNSAYRFLHDRVQQAAYSLIPNEQRQITRYQIGKLLLQHTPADKLEESIFDIVNHLNKSTNLIDSKEERHQLSELNLVAGKRALAATAYASASQYFDGGIKLLEVDCWESQYQLALSLYQSAINAEYLAINFARASTLANLVLEQVTTVLDRVKVYELQIQMYMAQSETLKALDVGKLSLELLGVDLNHPPVPSDIHLPQLSTIESLPVMQDAHQMAIMRMLMVMFSPAYTAQPALLSPIVLTAIDLSLKEGHSPLTAFAYVLYGILQCGVEKNLDKGYYCGLLALKVLDRFCARELECKVINLFNVFIRPWKNSLAESIKPLEKASQVGFEMGDIEYASYASSHYCTFNVLAGEPLLEVQKKQNIMMSIINGTNQDHSLNHTKIWQQFVLNLLEDSTTPGQLLGDCFEEVGLLAIFRSGNDRSLPFTAYLAKCILHYLFESYLVAVESAVNATHDADSAIGIASAIHNFYYSLCLLSDSQNLTENYLSSATDQKSRLNQVEINQKLMKEWAVHCPKNFNHKYDLVAAERYRVLGKQMKAIDLYDRAISGAKENGFIQEEALANELAAKFYLGWGKQRIAAEYMIEAYYCYIRWGARAKVKHLEQCYPQLLAPILQRQPMALSIIETVLATTDLATSQSGLHPSSSGSTSISAALDLATVLKASQTLSSEIELDKLLATLLHTVLENAGADKGVLLMPRENQWFVEAFAAIDQPTIVHSIALSDSLEMPQGLINTIKRSLQPLVVVDATVHPTFSIDPYVMHQQPKSLLCTPILNQGKLVAILYLENRVTAGAFTRDRVELLNLLCSQVAISLENARLFSSLKESQVTIGRSQRNLRTIFDNAHDAIFIHALDGTILDVNDRMLQIYGVRREEVTTLSFVADYSGLENPFDLFPGWWEQVLTGETVSFEWQAKRPHDDFVFEVEVKLNRIEVDGQDVVMANVRDITQRKQAEAVILQSKAFQERLAFLIQQTPIGMIEWNDEFKVLSWNPAAEKIFGYPAEEMLNCHAAQIVPELDRPHVAEVMTSLIKQEGGFYSLNKNIRKDNTIITCEWINTPLRDAQGNAIGIFSMIQDISDRIQAEAVILKNSQELAQKSQNLAEALALSDGQQQILALIAQRVSLNTILAEVARFIESHTHHLAYCSLLLLDAERRLRCAAAPSLPAAYNALIDGLQIGPEVGSCGTSAYYKASVTVTDIATDPLWANFQVALDFGLRACTSTPILGAEGQVLATLAMYQPVAGEFTLHDRKLMEVATYLSRIAIERHQADMRLQNTQLQMVQNEKMASLGNLVAGVAHEINNPIAFLKGSINNAKDHVQDLLGHLALYQQHHSNAAAPVQKNAEDIDLEFLSDDLPKLLDSMQGATDRITGISTSLRTFSRADTEFKVSANLHEGLDSTLLILKYRLKANEHRPAIDVIKSYGDLPLVDCFPGQLNQVFLNVLANAIDVFDEMAQTQSFSELVAHSQQITLRTIAHESQVEIQIADNGQGMTEEVKARIFDHLFTTKGVGKGTGLGLAIARQIIVEKHGGSLEVQSAPGQGTQFFIRLPNSSTHGRGIGGEFRKFLG